jgi:adenine-specific DNA-methyltransferase
VSLPSDQPAAVDDRREGDGIETAERNLRVWPESVSAVARWCRSKHLEPIPQDEVAGANDRERRQLAALGGIAAALAERSTHKIDLSAFPPAVQKWLDEAPKPPPELIDQLYADLKGEADPLALVYERIVSGPRRRWLGTFFTPSPVLDYMRAIVKRLPHPPKLVADPGAGVGAFTVAALEWWRRCEVHAVDVNLVTLGLLATRPDLSRGLAGEARSRLRIRHENFLEWLTLRWPDLEGPRLLMGNPPYTRHQQLSASEKLAARNMTGELAPGARAGLSTYFLAASLAALKPEDSLCLLLPANWLEADYARSVRQHIWLATKRAAELHLFSNELNVFPGAQVAAMVIFVGPEKKSIQSLKFIRVTGTIESGFLQGVTNEVPRVGKTPPSFSPTKLLRLPSRKTGEARPDPAFALGVIATVRRGVATGANSFFLRTGSEAALLPPGSCLPAIRSLRDLVTDKLDQDTHAGLSASGFRCWLLAIDEESVGDARIQGIIAEAEAAGVNKGYLCRTRDPWWAVERIPAPDILIGPMGKDSFRVVVNTASAIPTNTLYGIKLKKRSGVNLAENAEVLAEWLRSGSGQESLRSAARNHHGDGLVKLEPGALKQVIVPAEIAEKIALVR